MSYYTSKYSGEDIDTLLDKIAASNVSLAAANVSLSEKVQQLETRIAALEGEVTV
jgi:cell division septum initiation protein DivIVA